MRTAYSRGRDGKDGGEVQGGSVVGVVDGGLDRLGGGMGRMSRLWRDDETEYGWIAVIAYNE